MNKNPSDIPENDAKLGAAIERAEAEVERVKEWMAREQKEMDSHQSTRATDAIPGKAKEPSRPVVQRVATGGESLGVLNNILAEQRKSGVMAWRQLAIGIIAVIIATLGLIINSNRNTQTVVSQLDQSKLSITDPPDGASVGLGQRVRGLTPYPDRSHYLAVTMVRTGFTSLQPAFVSPGGAVSGNARFNDGGSDPSVGEDDEFTVRVLATKSRLESGNLVNAPDDAIFSKPITVRRTKPSAQIVINAPANGAEVGVDGAISGRTSFPDLTHYIVVRSLRVGTRYVQDRPSSISRNDGTFSGNAKFGGVGVGIGEQYEVQILATTSSLPAGQLTKDPPDAVLSNAVTVTRKK